MVGRPQPRPNDSPCVLKSRNSTSPSKTSHKKVDLQIRKKLGISDNLLRFSVGIEDIKDLMLDLDKSLKNNVR